MLSPVSFLADVTSTDEEEKLTRDASANEEWSKGRNLWLYSSDDEDQNDFKACDTTGKNETVSG